MNFTDVVAIQPINHRSASRKRFHLLLSTCYESNETEILDRVPSRVSIFKGGSKWNIFFLKIISSSNSDLDLEHESYI